MYLSNLVRLGASGVVLESDAQVLFEFPAGGRRANQTIALRDLCALVEEIVPPDAAGPLLAGRETRFDHAHDGARYRITVAPARDKWIVTIAPAPPAPAPAAPADRADNHLLGRLAVHYKLITMDQLEEAIREQGRRGTPLGAILLERGLISQAHLDKLLAAQAQYLEQHKRPRAATPAASYTPAATRQVGSAGPLDAILQRAIDAGASDVLVHPDAAVKLRVQGTLTDGAE